ncbi:MAG: hypothetical protein GX234_11245 [Clostridiales bacterium]|nr:hypothetical protein [Clostridiales bacterium]
MKNSTNYLYEKLRALADSDYYPYHMPGHKRNMKGHPLDALYEIDITEIDGFDNLHEPEGILKESMERAAAFYGSERTYFLVNGSSCGVLSALMACADCGGKVLIGRNAHRSAYHALYLGKMEPVYIMPEIVAEYGFAGGICPKEVGRILEQEEGVKAVFLTSPTYDGMMSDIREIVKVSHSKNIPVIVDEAHGAHLPLFPEYDTAVACGADFVIQSIHKTLPAPTQTALLHVNGSLADIEKTERYLRIFQTSSPSYILMSGMDECFRLLSKDGRELAKRFRKYRSQLDEVAEELSVLHIYGSEKDCRNWKHYGIKDADRGKLVISVKNPLINGKELYDELRMKYHLQMEMSAASYALAMLTIMDAKEGFDRLGEALIEMDRKWEKADFAECSRLSEGWRVPCYNVLNPVRMKAFEAQNAQKEWILLKQSQGRIAAGIVNLYPPGIPLLVPGEEITEDFIEFVNGCLLQDLNVQGIQRMDEALIPVIQGVNHSRV